MVVKEQTSDLEGSGIFPMLLVMVCCTFLAWLAKFHWERRRIYQFAAKLSGPPTLPILGSATTLMGNPERIFHNMMHVFWTYPEISKLWLGPKLFVNIMKPEHLEVVLNHPNSLQKDNLYLFGKQVIGTGLFVAPLHIWKKNRKLINPAFNQKILDSFVDIYADRTKVFLDILRSKVGEKDIDVFHLAGALSLDSLYESAMGVKLESQLNPSGLSKTIDTIMMCLFLKMVVLWYHYDFIFNFTKLSKKFSNAISELHQFTQKIVTEKRELFDKNMVKLKNGEEIDNAENGKRKSFLDHLLLLTHKGDKMTDIQLRQEVDTFTIAGTDTTGSTMCFCFMMLGMHQDMQNKVVEEVLEVVGEDRDVTYEDLPKLVYLERFIKETLRLFPVAGIILRHAEGDIDIGDHVIPKGSSMCLAIIRVHRNEKYWPNPLKFDPDRFTPEEIAKRHPYAFIPFAAGPRSCIGAKYAMMSMKTMLAMLLRKYVIKTDYKTVDEIKIKLNLVMRPVDGYKISVELRK